MPEAVDQVGGAVHRVQNPAGAAPVQSAVVLLLPHKLDVRGQDRQALPQELLHCHIHIGDIVRLALGPDAADGGGIGQPGHRFPHRLDDLFLQRYDLVIHTAAPWVRMDT